MPEFEDTSFVTYSDLSQRDKRSLVFHLLYAMESFDYDVSLESIVDKVSKTFDFTIPQDCGEIAIAQVVADERDALDAYYLPHLSNWRLDRLSIPTKLILRYAIWEMLHTDQDLSVIINEAVELAKAFAEKDAYKFINGILDTVSKKIVRPESASVQTTSDK